MKHILLFEKYLESKEYLKKYPHIQLEMYNQEKRWMSKPINWPEFFLKYGQPSLTEILFHSITEGVADTFLQTHHHFNPDFTDCEEKYKKQKSKEDNDIIVYNYKDFNGHFVIIKNPKSLKNIDRWTRGIIDKNGNLYVQQFLLYTHSVMIKTLSQLNILDFTDNWHKEIPKTFVTIQRYDNTNTFGIGESNMGYYNYYNNSELNIKKYKETFQEYLNKAKNKNPQYNFTNIPIDEIKEPN